MGGFSVYAAMGEGFKSAIKGLESRIEDISHEMQAQAEADARGNKSVIDAQKAYNTAFNKNPTSKTTENAKNNLDLVVKQADAGKESATILSIDMQRFIQEWSFLLTNATNAMKTYGDGLMSLARNL